MSKLKKKSTKSEVIETTAEENSYMNEDEKEVLEADSEKIEEAKSEVSAKKMNRVLNLLQENFNLRDKGFELAGYADKGNKIVTTLSNGDYDVQFTLKSQDTIMLLSMPEQ